MMGKDVVYRLHEEVHRVRRVDFAAVFTADQMEAIRRHVDHEIISATIPLQDRVSELERQTSVCGHSQEPSE